MAGGLTGKEAEAIDRMVICAENLAKAANEAAAIAQRLNRELESLTFKNAALTIKLELKHKKGG